MTDYHPLIARAVEGLDRSTGEARRALYERARNALVAQLRSNQPALSEADITKERLALEEAIRKVEAEAARKSLPETRAEPRSAAPSEGMPDGDNIPATTGSQLHRTKMIGRRLCRADKHQYSCPARPMTATTQISRPAAAWVCCPEERRGSPAESGQAVAR